MLSRNEWFSWCAAGVAAKQVKKGLAPAPDLAAMGGEDVTAALISTWIASLHSEGRLLDEIVEEVERGRWLAAETDAAAAAFECVSAYRGNHYPDPDWWDAELFCFSFLESWVGRALSATDRGTVEETLRKRWLLGPEVVAALIDSPGEPEVSPSEAVDRLAESSPQFARFLEMDEVAEAKDEVLEELPELVADNEAVREFAAAIAVFRLLEQLVSKLEAEEIESELNSAGDQLKEWLKPALTALSPLESRPFMSPIEGEKTLRRALEETKRRHLIVMLGSALGMANGIADKLGGETLAPDWLGDEIFAGGARSGTFHFGPTAYLWLGLEPHEVPADGISGLHLALQQEGGRHLVEISFGVQDGEDSFYMDFGLGHSDETRRWLAQVVLSQRITMDVFEIEPGGGVRLLKRAAATVEELAEEIAPRVVAAIEDNGLAPLLTGKEMESHVIGGFAASENAKSELLLTLSSDAGGDDADVRSARQALLDSHVSRAWTLYNHGDPTDDERRVEAAMRTYAEARSRVLRQQDSLMSEDPQAAHRALVSPFARDGRAVVHFNFSNSHLEGFWSAEGGEDRDWLSFESVDLLSLIEATEPWLEGRRGDSDRLIAAAAPLAAEIDEALKDVGVSEIVMIPWGLLHGVPFGALPLGEEALGDRYAISYAPSLAILEPLLEPASSPKEGVELISAHGGTLPWADPEIHAAHVLCPDARVTPDEAPRAEVVEALQRGRLVHLASHGKWWRDDHFASHLDLCLPGPFERRISAAEIHRDLDLTGTELLILSACDTGRSPTLHRGIESYLGLDAAFLARGARAVLSTLWPIDDLAAMLFTTNLHARLLTQESLSAAFASSVNLLRSGAAHELPPDDPAGEALDATTSDWRDKAFEQKERLSSSRAWAAFRLSGVPWLVDPS